MKTAKISKMFFLVGICFVLAMRAKAENTLQEKRLQESIEKFVNNARKSERNYTTISVRGWRNELNMPPLSTEDMIRKVLVAFDRLYPNLKLIDWQMIYVTKLGGGIECDFLVIHHETEKKSVNRFAGK